jgi:hypothetical protein
LQPSQSQPRAPVLSFLFGFHWGGRALALVNPGGQPFMMPLDDIAKGGYGWQVDEASLRQALPRVDASALAPPVAVNPLAKARAIDRARQGR